jgi:hypothetical protein
MNDLRLSDLIALFSLVVSFFSVMFCFLQWKKSYKQIEKENRKEFLIDMIKDEKAPISARIEAGNEYLREGYNGVVKKYILDNQYYNKNAFNTDKI